jgi:superfamily II DNA helicase RecQ
VTQRQDSFEKDGRRIEFRRVYLTERGRDGTDPADALILVESRAAPSGSGSRRRRAKKLDAGAAQPGRAAPPALVDALRELRSTEARARAVPAYCVFTDATLRNIATLGPTDEAGLLSIKGVGPGTAERYGAAILELVRRHGEA